MVWIVLAVILLIILTLIFSPVKIFVNYQNGKTSIIIKYLFIKKNVNQIRKRKKNLKKSKSEEHNKDESRQKKSKFRNIIPEDNKEKTEFVLNILKSTGKTIKHITKHICVKNIDLDFIISDLDAYDCALKLGKTNIAVYNIIAYLNCFIKLNKKSIDIKCIYNQPECSYNLSFMIKISPAAGISAMIVFIFTFLVNNKSIKNQNKYEPQL